MIQNFITKICNDKVSPHPAKTRSDTKPKKLGAHPLVKICTIEGILLLQYIFQVHLTFYERKKTDNNVNN